ncbi:MAG: hypothetical protein ABSF34_08905 [Verrucomicrobiota bacterium]
MILGEVEARALKQSMSLQISRAAVDRLLDASNPSVIHQRGRSRIKAAQAKGAFDFLARGDVWTADPDRS